MHLRISSTKQYSRLARRKIIKGAVNRTFKAYQVRLLSPWWRSKYGRIARMYLQTSRLHYTLHPSDCLSQKANSFNKNFYNQARRPDSCFVKYRYISTSPELSSTPPTISVNQCTPETSLPITINTINAVMMKNTHFLIVVFFILYPNCIIELIIPHSNQKRHPYGWQNFTHSQSQS